MNELNELLNYDPNTGNITWAINGRKMKIGDIAGCVHPYKLYRRIRVNSVTYPAHHIAWYLHYGVWPKEQIDHINGIRDDNRIANLREATNAENAQNRQKRSDNKSGYVGVYWNKASGKWASQIKIKPKVYHLGLFDDPAEAHQAYLDAKAQLHTFNPVPRK